MRGSSRAGPHPDVPLLLLCRSAARGRLGQALFLTARRSRTHWPRPSASGRRAAVHHVASPSFDRLPRRRRRRRAALAVCAGRLADQAGPHHRAVRRRRHHRHPRSRPRARTGQGVRPDLHHREQGRRWRQPRRRPGRQVAARRLHAADGNRRHAVDQSLALSEDAVRRGQGLRADHARRRRAERHGDESGQGAGSGHQRRQDLHRLRARPSRQAQHGVERQRHFDPSFRRAVQVDDRHLHGPLPVPRLGAGAARPDRRHDGSDVRQPALGAAADQVRQADRARGDERRTQRRPARRADDRRGRAGQGLRGELVVRPAGAGRHAGRHRQPAAAGIGQGTGDAGAEGAPPRRRARSPAA